MLRGFAITGFVSFLIGIGSVEQQITEEDLQKFKDGYNDGMIDQISQLTRVCEDVLVYRGSSISGKQWGLIYKCSDDNETMISIRYSGVKGSNLNTGVD